MQESAIVLGTFPGIGNNCVGLVGRRDGLCTTRFETDVGQIPYLQVFRMLYLIDFERQDRAVVPASGYFARQLGGTTAQFDDVAVIQRQQCIVDIALGTGGFGDFSCDLHVTAHTILAPFPVFDHCLDTGRKSRALFRDRRWRD